MHSILTSRFSKNEKGNIAVLAGIVIIPLIVALGAALDIQREGNAKLHLQSAMDSASLFAANLASTGTYTDAQITDKAKPFVIENYHYDKDGGAVTNFQVTTSATTVSASAQISVPNYFMSIFGIPSNTIKLTSTAMKGGTNLEIALVLDNTYSMSYMDTAVIPNKPAIELATGAANLFVDLIKPGITGSNYTKVAVIPYNNSVNLGTEALASQARGSIAAGTSTTPGSQNFTFRSGTDNRGNPVYTTYPSSTCVTERQNNPGQNHAYTDDPFVNGGAVTDPAGYFYGPNSTSNTGNGCIVTPMLPLSLDPVVIKNTIGAMVAGNSTAGQTGIEWGWYALSPRIGIWTGASIPSPNTLNPLSPQFVTGTLGLQQVHKILILLTDGEYNTVYCKGVSSAVSNEPVGSGSQAKIVSCPALADTYTVSKNLCSAMKAAGVEIYVVSFQLTNSTGDPVKKADLVNSCATDASHVVNGDTANGPKQAFTEIANKINSIRLLN